MPKDTDANIQDRLDMLKGKGAHEAEATLLLAQKVGQVESALVSIKESLDSIHQTLSATMDKEEIRRD